MPNKRAISLHIYIYIYIVTRVHGRMIYIYIYIYVGRANRGRPYTTISIMDAWKRWNLFTILFRSIRFYFHNVGTITVSIDRGCDKDLSNQKPLRDNIYIYIYIYVITNPLARTHVDSPEVNAISLRIRRVVGMCTCIYIYIYRYEYRS